MTKTITLESMAHTTAHELAREDALARGDNPATSCCRGHCSHFDDHMKDAMDALHGLPPNVIIEDIRC